MSARIAIVTAVMLLAAACGQGGQGGEGDGNQTAAPGGPPPTEFAPMEAEQGADVTDSASRLASNQDGERMFNRRCGACHLGGGMGSNVLTPRVGPENALLARRPGGVPADYVRQVVRQGLGAMPPLTRVEVTDPELDAIAAWLAEDHTQ